MATSPDQNNTQPQVVDNTDPGYTTPAAMDYISLTPTSSRIANIDPNIFREVTSQEYVNAQKTQDITREKIHRRLFDAAKTVGKVGLGLGALWMGAGLISGKSPGGVIDAIRNRSSDSILPQSAMDWNEKHPLFSSTGPVVSGLTGFLDKIGVHHPARAASKVAEYISKPILGLFGNEPLGVKMVYKAAVPSFAGTWGPIAAGVLGAWGLWKGFKFAKRLYHGSKNYFAVNRLKGSEQKVLEKKRNMLEFEEQGAVDTALDRAYDDAFRASQVGRLARAQSRLALTRKETTQLKAA